MKTEITIPKAVANDLYVLINKAIEEELNFPDHSDEWMTNMQTAQLAIGDADRIIIEG